MKKTLQNLTLLLVITPVFALFSVSPTLALSEGEDTTKTTAQNKTEVKPVDRNTSSQAFKTELSDRIAKRKSEFKTNLTIAASERLKTRCKSAQGIIKKIEDSHKQPLVARQTRYENLVTKLSELRDKLKAAEIDTTALDAQLLVLDTKIATFNTELAALQQARVDLQALDCTADPAAFKASLEAARAQREKVVKAAADIRVYSKDTIKPNLVALRKALQAKVAGSVED